MTVKAPKGYKAVKSKNYHECINCDLVMQVCSGVTCNDGKNNYVFKKLKGSDLNKLTNKKTMTTKEVAEALGVSRKTVVTHARKMGLTRNGVQTFLEAEDIRKIEKEIGTSGRNDLANICVLKNKLTIKEMSVTMEVGESTIKRAVEKLRPVLGNIEKGTNKAYLFDETQATKIKQEIQKAHNLQSRQIDTVSTETEENDTILKALSILKARKDEYRRRAEIAETKCIELQPKADYADLALKSNSEMNITDVGKILKIRQSDMFSFLRYKRLITSKNIPTQKAINYGVLSLKKYVINTKKGTLTKEASCMTDSNLQTFVKYYINTGNFDRWKRKCVRDSNIALDFKEGK